MTVITHLVGGPLQKPLATVAKGTLVAERQRGLKKEIQSLYTAENAAFPELLTGGKDLELLIISLLG